MIKPFKKHKKTLIQQVSKKIKKPLGHSHLPFGHAKNKKEKLIHLIQHILLYFSLLLAGYLIAKLQTLLLLK